MKTIFLITFITYLTITSINAAKHFEQNDFQLYYPFFPFGKNFDYVLTDPPNYIFSETDEDLGFFNHYLSKDLPIFHDLHVRDIFMGVNGYVSFGAPYQSNKAEKYPAPFPGISVFHTDLIFTDLKDSHFSFQEYTEKDKAFMALAQFELEVFGQVKNFYPNHVVTVTWSKAQKKNGKGQATFQLVIISDGFNTYFVLNYKDINISRPKKNFCPVTIGWQENYKSYFAHENMQLVPGSPYKPIRMQRRSNVHFPGKWIYSGFASKIALKNMQTPPPSPTTAKPLPAACPSEVFCKFTKRTINAWPGYPGFYVVCPPGGKPVCMACAGNTVFSKKCRTCVHPEQLKKAKKEVCPKPQKSSMKKVKQTPQCNHREAKRFCTLKKEQCHKGKTTLFQGRFRNHNDLLSRTFYLCVDIYGSFCMPCPPGTVFARTGPHMGACVHPYQARNIVW
ncbi:uncharacterized protein [Clytia hemisphaerica]|uniref:NIDO domain-containing protein n=1 Tax=Clytia hemisphaerica TaxID=252671 RepID=A0A7M5XBR9_9CNID|eukprot:TCONS_00005741-protein